MECQKERNLENCNCSAGTCPRKGICCECIQFHLNKRELPACAFSDKAERTYDRSFEHFARLVSRGEI